MYLFMCIYIYIYTYIRLCVYIYIYIYIYISYPSARSVSLPDAPGATPREADPRPPDLYYTILSCAIYTHAHAQASL